MHIEYIRSSLLGTWETCQQKAFFVYNLGIPDLPNIKTEVGTICHRVYETLAELTLNYQKTGKYEFQDKDFGLLSYSKEEFLKRRDFTFSEVEAINKERIDKNVYISIPRLSMPYHRLGEEIVEDILLKCYDYYTKKSHNTFTDMHYSWARNFVWLALESEIYDPRLREIVSPEINFDLEIDEDWSKFEYFIDKEKISGKLRLKGTIDLVTRIDEETIEIVDWKGLPVDTKIPTPSGWTTMGGLQIGDTVFDKDGNHTKVVGKSQIKHKPCYKIYFDDKTDVICDNEHLWTLHDNTVVPITSLKIGDKISVTKPIITDDKELPIDPYVLGLWLGNGRNKNGEICGPDQFIFDEIIKRGYQLGEDINKDGCPSRTVYGLITKLKHLNLLNNKHIPEIYFRSSYKQRLDLLRGLMDTDGNVNTVRKQAVFTTCNQTLSNDAKKLLITLGQRVNQSNITRNTNFKNDVKVFPLHFRPISINPFMLPRKADKILGSWGPGNSNYRKITNIELINSMDTQCISVDSTSNTYLCTENMIPTHNTGKRYNWGKETEKTYAALSEDDQLMLYYYAARRIFPEVKHIILTIFFVRDGGAFTTPIDDSCIPKILNNMQKTTKEIQKTEFPKLRDYYHKDFMCYRLCTFFKNKVNGESQCSHVMKYNKKYGMKATIDKFKREGFEISKYQNPGE